ncbi:hypothetical protein [Streptomyces sp. Go-475]|uniref:Gfo/Idh/MocA family protein n=1 Tax=Streptomyces sp. Go-475 TaxID=2072505 RepID=UPI0018E53E6E|nr:hypothetical protein [Streptomyces sp. Go-475]
MRHGVPGENADLFAPEAPVGYDIRAVPVEGGTGGLRPVRSLAEARALLDPERTVVHLCTPPRVRAEVLEELAVLGFRAILVEKPLAADNAEVDRIRALRDRHGLRLAVVAPWLHSTLTQRLEAAVLSGGMGALRSIDIRQNKPRLTRTLQSRSHPTVFDIELPHAVGVALRLAGHGRVTEASCEDARAGDVMVRFMGAARSSIRHDSGVVTTITSDLMSATRERTITLRFSGGTLTGHYPVSAADSYAQLHTEVPGRPGTSDVFEDEALTACLLQTYRDFAAGADLTAGFALQAQVVSLLTAAKRLSIRGAAAERAADPAPVREGAVHAC